MPNLNMDSKKRLKRSKQDVSAAPTPEKVYNVNEITDCDFPNDCSSSDFMSSQECFSVGWDWSGHINGKKKPTIRVIERPVQKKSQGVQLLECSRPRRLIRNCNTDNFDDSVLFKELKSLAAGCKGIPESTSPVASPPSFRRKKEVLVTPTSLRESMRRTLCSKSVESSASVSTLPSSSKESPENDLNELLDDSLGADLLKCTQDIEQGLRQNESKTPNLQRNEINCLSSAKRRNRLSLSSKKAPSSVQKSMCRRRINDSYEENLHKFAATKHEPKANHNNNNDSNKIVFDDIDDEAMLLTIGKLEEQEFVESREEVAPQKNSRTTKGPTKAQCDKLTLDEEDDFVSPDLLDLIDVWEKKATQECTERKNQESKVSKSLSVQKESLTNNLVNKKTTPMRSEATSSKDSSYSIRSSGNINKQYETLPKRQDKRLESTNQQPPRKTLCLGKSKTICTPEEIEKKRQEAKKRLQLKKKGQ